MKGGATAPSKGWPELDVVVLPLDSGGCLLKLDQSTSPHTGGRCCQFLVFYDSKMICFSLFISHLYLIFNCFITRTDPLPRQKHLWVLIRSVSDHLMKGRNNCIEQGMTRAQCDCLFPEVIWSLADTRSIHLYPPRGEVLPIFCFYLTAACSVVRYRKINIWNNLNDQSSFYSYHWRS